MIRHQKVKTLVGIGMFSSISYILMLMNFPFPGFPSFLLVDFSDIPALIAAVIFGPAAGIMVELIKNSLDYMMTGAVTGVPVGQIANFSAGVLFVLPAYYIYKKISTKKGMAAGLLAGTVIMSLVMSILNYFVFLPAYTLFLGAEAMSSAQAKQMVVSFIFPFNLVKGFLITVVFMLLFVRLNSWLEKQTVYKNI
ncbi:riboflavin transporter FmnP [Peribacillus deserti]|uniref:Riboflavin transporter n=1 Tax=Peribacillus deserti TaxID=673318 RepID=A0ABS2QNJ3_9BACI|nr:ECF transporter S component [Peribacillus deserti]MBM7694734.1 riboflavin transporter FmnP [Peribacillus deserti]